MFRNKNHKILILILLTLPSILHSCNHSGGQGMPVNTEGPSPIGLAVNLGVIGDLIPEDFIGLSFETGSARINNAGMVGYFFSAGNKQSLTIFKQLGIKNLRIGGGSVDANQTIPSYADIDSLFAFAEVAQIKVIYSFRLLNGDINEDVTIAKYIWDHYKSDIECFAIGNEPDWDSYHKSDPEITDYPTFLTKWKKFADSIITAIPEAKFMGPHTGSNFPIPEAKNTYYNGKSWTVNFANDLKNSGIVSLISQHNYVGQDATGRTPQEMIDKMLSSTWVNSYYPTLYNANLLPVIQNGYRYRLAESNSFSGEVDGGSNSFATALFSLDYLHWWAEHKCSGINFHNKQWVLNAPIFKDASGNLQVNPVGYGIMAFNLGGHGYILPITITNTNKINLTAYAVKNNNNVCITIINKEHGISVHDATITIDMFGNTASAEMTSLVAPNNDVASKNITFGGATIFNDRDWEGKWTPLTPDKDGKCVVTVSAGSATIVKITLKPV